MKKISILILCFITNIICLHAQNIFPASGSAGIGTTTPDASSILEMVSTTKGMLVPRMTKVQRDAIIKPATGLLIYQTNSTPGFYYYNGSSWQAVIQKFKGWSLTGNAGTIAGTNFIGTTDLQPLIFKVNNAKAGYLNYANDNTGFGILTLNSNTGSVNTAVGFSALYYNDNGDGNTATGAYSLYRNINGTGNTASGANALIYNSTGYYNTAFGLNALFHNTYGFSNTAIGAQTDVNDSSYNNSTAIGYSSLITSSNQVRIGNSRITSIGGYVNWSNISDGRVKKNIKANVPGLAFINKLKPITYNLNLDAIDNIAQTHAMKDKNDKATALSQQETVSKKLKEQIVYTGFVAQDVEKAAKSLQYDFSGVDVAKNDKDLYGLRYSDFVVPLVKAVQELSKMNDEKDAAIQQQDKKINDLQNQINELKSMVGLSQSSSLSTVSGQPTTASLQQNIPNPFNQSTTIHYNLPSKFNSAQIVISDYSGKALKQFTVSSTKGSITVYAATLSSGTYNYSLIVDGKLIDTKQMILTR
jgi:hypothetical protein